MGFFKEMKHRAQFRHIERKKNRIITRQNISMKIHALPHEIKASANRWWYNLVNDVREIKSLKGSLRLGLWLSMIGIVVVWAFYQGKVRPVFETIATLSSDGGSTWISLTQEIAAKLPFIPGLENTLQSLNIPFLGQTLVEWLIALILFAVRFIIWCVPALLLVKHYSRTKGIRSYSRMFRRPFSLRYCWGSLIVILFWILATSIPSFIREGGIFIKSSFQPTSLLSTVIAATICEEILLRGWLLNALNTRSGPVYSSVVVTIFYFLLLLPNWIQQGIFSYPVPLMISFLIIFSTTFALCMAFNRSRSIWTSMVLRGFWALCTVLFPVTY